MKQYHEHLEAILKHGTRKEPAREGMPGSISLFGYQNRYDLSKGFPILTTKKVNFKNIVVELLWFLKGDTNIKYLVDNGCNIWNEDAYNYYCKVSDKEIGIDEFKVSFEEFVQHVKTPPKYPLIPKSTYQIGDCGKQYGWLWRNFGEVLGEDEDLFNSGIDQIENFIEGLKTSPMGRRHIITAWNPVTLDDMALNACHAFVQFNCRKLSHSERIDLLESYDGFATNNLSIKGWEIFMDEHNIPKYHLDCQLYQRSADMFLGVPYNIASYALLTEIIAKICNMVPGEFVHTFGDSHIYDNHIDQVKEILSRDPEKYELPKLKTHYNLKQGYSNVGMGIFKDLEASHFELENYQYYPAIKAKLSTGLK